MTREEIQTELLLLPERERVLLAHWLLATVLNIPVDTAPDEEVESESDDTPLLKVAGIFSGGPGNSAERVEEILEAEVSPVYGLSAR